MSTIPDYSVMKMVLKLCHNALQYVGIKCINLTSGGLFEDFQ